MHSPSNKCCDGEEGVDLPTNCYECFYEWVEIRDFSIVGGVWKSVVPMSELHDIWWIGCMWREPSTHSIYGLSLVTLDLIMSTESCHVLLTGTCHFVDFKCGPHYSNTPTTMSNDYFTLIDFTLFLWKPNYLVWCLKLHIDDNMGAQCHAQILFVDQLPSQSLHNTPWFQCVIYICEGDLHTV